MNENMARVEQLTERMMAILKRWIDPNPGLSAPKQEMSITAGALYWQTAMQKLAQVFEQKAAFWGVSLKTLWRRNRSIRTLMTLHWRPLIRSLIPALTTQCGTPTRTLIKTNDNIFRMQRHYERWSARLMSYYLLKNSDSIILHANY